MLEGGTHQLTMNETAQRLPTDVSTTDRAPHWEESCRRALDVAVAVVALAFLAPVLAVVALLVKLDSEGPVLFRQVRIGRNRRRNQPSAPRDGSNERRTTELFGQPFTLYKFRTMFADAPERFPHLYRYEYSEEELRSLPIKVLVAQKEACLARTKGGGAPLGGDPRVTRLGQWLRRTSLDEIPNLINVLKGDMHLVGPRPDIAANIRYYNQRELRILDIKPGITGLAQVRGRGLLTFEETNACDLDYVERRSFTLDLKILLQTLPALIRRHGAF